MPTYVCVHGTVRLAREKERKETLGIFLTHSSPHFVRWNQVDKLDDKLQAPGICLPLLPQYLD